MGERKGTEKTPIRTIRIPSFFGGINTAVNAREIEDHELVSITNMEYDDSNDLVTRNGVVSDGTTRANPFGSVYVFSTESAFIGILYNFSNTIISRPLVLGSETNLGTFANAGTGRWYWKQLANVAVAATNGDTIQVVGGAPGTASVLAAAPDSRYIEEWRSRLFLVHSANPNRVQCSDLGTATTWNTGGLTNPAQGIIFDVAPGDGDVITGLFAFKERLFIFKRRRIYVLRAMALPETDPNSWEVVEYSKHIGCVNQATVREVFDDVLFLSEGGLTSLKAAEITADFASAIVSQKVALIQRIKQNATEMDSFGFTFPDKSQYILCLGSGASAAGPTSFILDYKNIRQGVIRWTQFGSNCFGTAMDAYRIGQTEIVYVMGNTLNRFAKYIPNVIPTSRSFEDIPNVTPAAISTNITTKTFDYDLPDVRKNFLRWYLVVERVDGVGVPVTLSIGYTIQPGTFAGGDGGNYNLDIDTPAGGGQTIVTIRRAIIWAKRKGYAINFSISVSAQVDAAIIIRAFGLHAAVLGDPVTEQALE